MPPQNDGLGVRFGERHDHPQVLDVSEKTARLLLWWPKLAA